MRRLMLVVVALSAALAAPGARAQGTPPTPVRQPDPLLATFSPDAAAPYFANGPAGEAAAHFALEEWQAARDGFLALLGGPDAPKDDAGRARVQLLLGECDAHLSRWKEAAVELDAAAAGLPLLADWANYEAARAYYFQHDWDKAMARADKVAADSIPYAETRLLVGDVLTARSKWKDALKHYEKYLADYPNGIRVAEARFHLAEAYEKTGKVIPDALVAYRQVAIEDPLGSWGEKAKTKVAALLKNVKKKKDLAKYEQLTAQEYVTRGKVYFENMRNPESEKDFADALEAPGADDELRCVAAYHRAQSAFKQRQRTRSAPLFDQAIEICAKTKNVDMQARVLYQAGRGYSYTDTKEAPRLAIARYERVEKEHPEHSVADDARLREAEEWDRLAADDPAAPQKITELLSTLPTIYPEGDMRAEALWRLGWREWRAQHWQAAIDWFDKEIASMPHDDNYWAQGQAQYWKARAFEKLGKKDKAILSYRAELAEYPLSYYSLLTLNRLREGYPSEFKLAVDDLKKPPKGWVAGTPVFNFKPRAIYGMPGFRRGLELLKLGLGTEAERELAKIGIKVPDGRKKVTDPDQQELLWATALLYDRAHRYDKSHWVARWSTRDYELSWPTEANRAKWEIAYPHAFWHILDPAAREQGFPPELLIAFVREESAFNPLDESFANAIGLTQMIFPTANRFGKGLGFPITRENLRDPVKNVAVGSRWLAFLWKNFEQHVGLIVEGYNAGEGAVWHWLCERGDWQMDEFAEAVPYDETRLYSKRVLNSYFIYSWLKDGTIPEVPNDIPPSVINQKRCKALAAPKK